jgi:Spy/CpxP family protein refolding chaperone
MKRLIGLMLLTVALTYAQEPEMFAWWDRPIARNLNLSPEQEQQIRAAVREYRDRLIEQRAAVQIAEGNLRDLMNEDQVNEPKTREAIDKVVSARGELMRLVSQMTLRLRVVLTPPQWQRVQRARAARPAAQRRAAPVNPQRPARPLPPVY